MPNKWSIAPWVAVCTPIMPPSTFVARHCAGLGHGRKRRGTVLPSVLHASFSRWGRIFDIVIAHASLIRQFWFLGYNVQGQRVWEGCHLYFCRSSTFAYRIPHPQELWNYAGSALIRQEKVFSESLGLQTHGAVVVCVERTANVLSTNSSGRRRSQPPLATSCPQNMLPWPPA